MMTRKPSGMVAVANGQYIGDAALSPTATPDIEVPPGYYMAIWATAGGITFAINTECTGSFSLVFANVIEGSCPFYINKCRIRVSATEGCLFVRVPGTISSALEDYLINTIRPGERYASNVDFGRVSPGTVSKAGIMASSSVTPGG